MLARHGDDGACTRRIARNTRAASASGRLASHKRLDVNHRARLPVFHGKGAPGGEGSQVGHVR
jgi:hypothetical protein